MKLNYVAEILSSFGFTAQEFSKTKITEDGQVKYKVLDFKNVYSDKLQRELYILVENLDRIFNKEEIDDFQKKVARFIYSRPNNDALKFNINLVLICPFGEDISQVVSLERDKYYCRKIFINSGVTSEEDFMREVYTLPSIPISKILKGFALNNVSGMDHIIKKVIENEDLLNILCSDDEIQLEKIEKELLAICEKG